MSQSVCAEETVDSAESQGFLSDVVLWQDASLSYLYGKQFEVDADEQQTVTFEHVSGLSFGDTFLFVDFIDYRDSKDDDSYYGEFSPRFSASKIADVDASFGPIKDVLIATTYEFGKGDVESFLYGFGAALGFSLVLVLFAAMRERINLADVPKPFQGAAIGLISAGIMSLAFMGFSGLVAG